MSIVVTSQESNTTKTSAHNIYNVDKNKSYKTNNHIFNNTHFYNKGIINHKQFNELHNQNK